MTRQQPPTVVLIFKVCDAAAWAAALRTGIYTGSADDHRDGYIHFSTAGQVEGTLAKYFRGRADLVLLAVPAAALGDHLKFEPSRGGELFPHLYGSLPAASVAWQQPVRLGVDGRHVLPDLAAASAPL